MEMRGADNKGCDWQVKGNLCSRSQSIIMFAGVIQNGISPVTPRMNLSCSNSQWPVFKSLQLQGCEVLAHFLGSSPDGLELPYHHFTLGKSDVQISSLSLLHDSLLLPLFLQGLCLILVLLYRTLSPF